MAFSVGDYVEIMHPHSCGSPDLLVVVGERTHLVRRFGERDWGFWVLEVRGPDGTGVYAHESILRKIDKGMRAGSWDAIREIWNPFVTTGSGIDG